MPQSEPKLSCIAGRAYRDGSGPKHNCLTCEHGQTHAQGIFDPCQLQTKEEAGDAGTEKQPE